MPKSTAPLLDWELVLSSAARLQRILPDAVLVGGTASAIHASHHYSRDADPALTDRRQRFDEVLAQLEAVAGWTTARVQRPVQILGSLDGIWTGIRQLILKRNATRNYLDFVALADRMGAEKVAHALQGFDRIYRQENAESPLQQLQAQLANPLPYDLEGTELREYKNPDARWHHWQVV